MNRIASVLPALLLCACSAFGQALDSPWQIKYFANLDKADSAINMSNSGANATTAANGYICANVYAFNYTGSLAACCTCRIAANALVSLNVRTNILGATPPGNSAVVKILASQGSLGTVDGVCN